MKIVKGLIGLSLAATTLTGCNFMGTAHSEDKTVIVSDDVALSSTMDDAEVAISKPQEIELTEQITYSELLGIRNDQLYFNKDKALYKSGLNPQQSLLIKDGPMQEMSKDASRGLYTNDEGIFVYHVDTNETVKVAGPTNNNVSFADRKGEFVSYLDSSTLSYVFIHTSSLEKKEVDMQKLFNIKDFMIKEGKMYNDSMYMLFNQLDEGDAIYKLSPENKKELVLAMQHEEDRIAHFEIVNDNLLVFNGTYNEESGIFFYNMKEQIVNKVVSGATNSEGTWTPFFSISPDGTKMLFDESAPENGSFYNNVYIATIEGNQLTKSIRIMEKVQLPAVIALLAHWRDDSSAFYIPKSRLLNGGYSEEIIRHLSVYEIDQIKSE